MQLAAALMVVQHLEELHRAPQMLPLLLLLLRLLHLCQRRWDCSALLLQALRRPGSSCRHWEHRHLVRCCALVLQHCRHQGMRKRKAAAALVVVEVAAA